MSSIHGLPLAAISRRFVMAATFLGLAGCAAAQSTIAVMSLQTAIMSTKDGQKAGQEMTAKYTPKQKDLEQQRDALQQLTAQVQDPATPADKRAQLQRDIEEKNRKFTREQQDARDEFQADQQRLLGPISQRIQSVIAQYAKQKGFGLVLDATGPVVFAASSIDITKDVVELYDKASAAAPAATTPSTLAPAKPATPAKAPPKK